MDKRDEIVLYTKDTIVATTSRGNQEKWLDSDKNIWYKLDHHGFESLAETVASQILIHHSNAFELGIPVTEYGAQLRVHFSKQDIRDILNPLLQYYPEPFQAYLAERVEQVLMTQKKKYFKI